MIQRLIARTAAAVLATAAATLALPATGAQAAYCSGAGVSVLVDFGALGGGTATGCGSGSTADKAFGSAGFDLKPHPRQQGFVCMVNGKPSDGDCLATDSYWGFFVSDDGKGWVYASQGVYAQAVDAGDSVALVWQSTTAQRKPGQAPAPAPTKAPSTAPISPQPTKSASPKPTKHPSTKAPTPKPTGGTTAAADASETTSGTASAPGSSTASPSTAASESTSESPAPTEPTSSASLLAAPDAEGTPSSDETSGVSTTATEPTASGDGGGLPGWVPPGIVALLAVAAGGVAWARRAR